MLNIVRKTPGSKKIAFLVISILTSSSAMVMATDTSNKLVGRQENGSVVLPTNQQINPAGKQIEFRGRPNDVALSPDGKTAAFLNGAYQAIILVDTKTWTVKQEFSAAGSSASFTGIIYSRDGKQLYASQANGRIIIASVAVDGTLTLDQLFTALPKSTYAYPGREDGNPYPGGMALSEDGRNLYITLNRNNSLGVIDLASRSFVEEIAVGNVPYDVVIKGTTAYVSNRGGRRATVGDFTNDSSGTAIISDPVSGRATNGTVSIVDLKSGKVSQNIEVGLHPSALLIHKNHLFVANSNNDTVSIINLESEKLIKTINVEPFHDAPFGSSPNALAMMGDDQLLVSLGRNNAIAVFELHNKMSHAAKFKGLIPTAWYPTAIVTDPEQKKLIVANGKGLGSLGPDATIGPDPQTNKTGKWVHANLGSASLIPYPDQSELKKYTHTVLQNNNWNRINRADKNEREKGKQAQPVPLPKHLGQPSVFKHVFYIIKENRTYDQVLGDLPQGNGAPELVQFGHEVTPNQHAIAEQFVLFDNLYDSGSNSQDGHSWVTQAFVNDYSERPYGGFIRSYPFNGGDAMAYAPSGFIWENALKHGKSVRVYGEFVNGLRADGVEMGPWISFLGHGDTEAGVWRNFYNDYKILAGEEEGKLHVTLEAHSDIPSLEAIINKQYPPYHMVIPDQYRAQVFLNEFKSYVEKGNLPEFIIMSLTDDHTEGTKPNYPTPRAMVADNDLALGLVVEAISNSPYWKDSVIFVIEDDAQNGVDHVDGHRTIGYVISPYTKRHVVDSRYYTQIDFIRAMQQILGLPPMNQMDLAVPADSMINVFTSTPDFTPFHAVANQIALDEINPSLAKLKGIRKAWAMASSEMDFSTPDAADKELLNRVIWYSTKGFDKPYPGDSKVLWPHEVHSYLGITAKKNRKNS